MFGGSRQVTFLSAWRNGEGAATLTGMNFELSDVLKAIGPAASIIFAAWIFTGFLQQRAPAITRQTVATTFAIRSSFSSGGAN